MGQTVIKVLIVEDSPIVTAILKRILASSSEIEVVGTAKNGLEALELISNLQPHVITTDLHMPRMNGLEFTKRVMARFPRPILVISASVQKEDSKNVFQLLQAGALDIFPKPAAGLGVDYDLLKPALINKIKVLAGVSVFTHHNSRLGSSEKLVVTQQFRTEKSCQTPVFTSSERKRAIAGEMRYIIAIGASTGGPQALQQILSKLPLNLPIPILCVQHISEGFLPGLIDWLAATCQLSIEIATAGESPKPGTIYFPQERSHLELDNRGLFIYSAAPALGGHRPSVTVTMKSVAKIYGRRSIGVILTGMGRDGADGMLAISKSGGLTIAQDKSSCVIFGMPKEAIALGAVQKILPVSKIAPLLLDTICSQV